MDNNNNIVNSLTFADYFDNWYECLFLKDLTDKIDCGVLVLGKHALSDWLDTLSDIECNFLWYIVTGLLPCEGCEDEGDSDDEYNESDDSEEDSGDSEDGDDEYDECECCEELYKFDFEMLLADEDGEYDCDYDLVEMLFVIKILIAIESGSEEIWSTLDDEDYKEMLFDFADLIDIHMYKRHGRIKVDRFSLLEGIEGIVVEFDDGTVISLGDDGEVIETKPKYDKRNLSQKIRDFFDGKKDDEKGEE